MCYNRRMVSLIINNSVSQIEGLDKDHLSGLRKLLSYTSTSSNYYTNFNQQRFYLIDKKGNFPTGVLYLVKAFIAQNALAATVSDQRAVPKAYLPSIMISLNSPKAYPEQCEIAALAPLGKHRGVISACTGFGKSFSMALMINALKVKTLIVVPNLTLKTQLIQAFNFYFGKNSNIVIENIDSPRLKKLTDFDCLIIDEAHHAASKTYRKLNMTAWKGIYYRYFFTGTPFRSRQEEQILFESIAGEIIYKVSYKQALAKQYIAPIEAYYYELPKVKPSGDTGKWASMYSELVVKNDYRNLTIAKMLISLRESGTPSLCLVKEINHGQYLSEVTGVPFVNGQEDNKHLIDDFNAGRIKCLIGTTGVLGEGVDTRPTEFVLIAGLGKAKGAFMQQVGRGVRKAAGKTSCKVILFNDPSHKWTKLHFKAQVEILKEEYGVNPVKLDLA